VEKFSVNVASRLPSRRLAPRAPLPLQRQRAEHDGLRRALRAGPGRLSGRVVEVRQHPDAPLLDLRGLGVFRVIDVVTMEVLSDDALRLGLHPRRHERGQVAHRDAVEHELLGEQSHGVDGAHPPLRQPTVGCGLEQEPVAILPGQCIELATDRSFGRRHRTCRVFGGRLVGQTPSEMSTGGARRNSDRRPPRSVEHGGPRQRIPPTG
jgi:hypothetical protein